MAKIQSGFTQVAYCMEKIFLKLFARSQSRDIYTAMTIFLTGWKKKQKEKKEIFWSRMWAWIFLCQMMQSRVA